MGLLNKEQFQLLLDSVRKLEVGPTDFVVLRYPDEVDGGDVHGFANQLHFMIRDAIPEWRGQVLLLNESYGLDALSWLANVAERGVDDVLAELRDQRCSKEQLLETIDLLKKSIETNQAPVGAALQKP